MSFELNPEAARFAAQHAAIPVLAFLVVFIACQPGNSAEQNRLKARWARWFALGLLLAGGVRPAELKITGHIISLFQAGVYCATAIGLSFLALRLVHRPRIMSAWVMSFASALLFYTVIELINYS